MGKKNSSKLSDASELHGSKVIFPQELYTLNATAHSSSYEYIPYPEIILNDKVILIGKFFSHSLCQALITTFANSKLMESFRQRGTKDYAERFNDRLSVKDPEIASVIWDRLWKILQSDEYLIQDLGFGKAKGLNPQLRVYRYEKGHHFGKHYDESVNVNKVGKTKWTLLIYLSGDDHLVGGDTVFYSPYGNNHRAVHPSRGLALLHKHGVDCLLHEAEMVRNGTKWVLRSDVVF